jgi:hypothetical protein
LVRINFGDDDNASHTALFAVVIDLPVTSDRHKVSAVRTKVARGDIEIARGARS